MELDQFGLEHVLVLDDYEQGRMRDVRRISFFDKAYINGDFVRFTDEKPFKLGVVESVLRGEVVDFERLE